MAIGDTARGLSRGTALLLAMLAGAVAFAPAARAQWFGDRFPFGYGGNPYRPPPQHDYYSFPFFNQPQPQPSPSYRPFIRPPQPVESTKAPPPRKQETTPTNTILVIGDSLADWLAYGLEERFADTPAIGVVRKIKPTSGLIRYDPHSDAVDWPQALKDVLATEKPSAIVVMLGINDRMPLRERSPARGSSRHGPTDPAQASQPAAPAQDGSPSSDTPQQNADSGAPANDDQHQGGTYDFRSDKWTEQYDKRVDEMIDTLKAKGVPVLWVGLPALRGARATSEVSYLDDIYRERAEKAGIIYVDIWDGFVDEAGRYEAQGPDYEGQTRRLRTGDGVHFTKAGAVKLASFVEQQLRRVILNRAAPVATTAPEPALPAKPGSGGTHPVAGPVLPLTASAGPDGSGDLLGADNRAPAAAPDSAAAQVLSRGDPLKPPAGRADDFSWPHAAADTSGTADTAGASPAPAAAQPPPQSTLHSSDVKKPADDKASDASDPSAPRTSHTPSASLDGAAANAR